jgi:ATP-dependent protease ClpP protease subunit
MRFLKAAVLATAIIMMSCAGVQPVPEPQKLEITVSGGENSVAVVDASVDEYEDAYRRNDSPFLHPSNMMRINRAKDMAFMNIFSGLSVSDVKNLWQDIMYLAHETEIKTVKLFINSPGGDAFSGLALADLIIRAQNEFGIKFEANASGIIASAAVPPFTVCDKRYAAKGTIFMVHEAALWKWPGRESASDIRSQNELMILLQDRYLSYLVKRSKLSLVEWQAMEKATTWFSSDYAMNEIGIVDEIK